MKKLLSTFFIPAALLVACSEPTHTNTSSITDGNESYAEDSFSSSSSLTTRLDINYSDTLVAGDTTNFYMEYATWDTITVERDTSDEDSKDSTYIEKVCHEDILCLDSANTTVSLFLGNYPKAQMAEVSIRKPQAIPNCAGAESSIRVRR